MLRAKEETECISSDSFNVDRSLRIRMCREFNAPSTRIRIFLSPQLFPFGYYTATVHTHPANSTANPDIFKFRSPEWKKTIRNESDNVWTVESGLT